jgi:hypothetical protein
LRADVGDLAQLDTDLLGDLAADGVLK